MKTIISSVLAVVLSGSARGEDLAAGRSICEGHRLSAMARNDLKQLGQPDAEYEAAFDELCRGVDTRIESAARASALPAEHQTDLTALHALTNR